MEELTKSDEELAGDLQKNDQSALSELIHRYQNKLFYYANRLLGDPDDARDVVQDTFIKVYEHINSFDTDRKFSSWIYRIAHNLAINQINKNKRVSAMELRTLDWLSEHHQEVEDFLAQENRAELSRDMIKCLDLLRPEYKEVILLYYFENKSYEEISDIMRIPEATVGVWLKRAKAKLRDLIDINDGK